MGLKSEAEEVFALHLAELGIDFVRQVPVTEGRRWTWDFALLGPHRGIVVEVDGFFKGRHGKGWGSDYEKQNWATMNGIRCLRFSSTEAKNGKAKEFLQEWL